MQILDSGATEIVIPDGAGDVDSKIFISADEEILKKISRITKISISDSCTSRFSGLDKFSSLKEVELRGKAETLPNYFISLAKSVEKVTLPSTLKSISYRAFLGCENLKEINIPAALENIDGEAFMNCRSLEKIGLPKTMVSIGDKAFDGCNSLKNVYLPELTGKKFSTGGLPFSPEESNNGTEYTIPSHFEEILRNAFTGVKNTLKKIRIPQSIRTIGMDAFSGCSALETVEYENESMKVKFGIRAFENCTALKSIRLQMEGEDLPEGIFRGCFSLENVEIPENITEISTEAFESCTALKSLKLPEGLKKIGSSAFRNCVSLENIELPEGLESIREKAFVECSSLRSITIPSSVTAFGHEGTDKHSAQTMFAGCDSLKEAHLLFTQEEIDEPTFCWRQSYSYFERQTLKDEGKTEEEIRELEKQILGCTSLEVITLPNVKTMKGALARLPNLKKIIVPEGLSSLKPLDVVGIPLEAEIVTGNNKKILVNNVEKDGKLIAREIYTKVASKLIAVNTKETSYSVSNLIKQVEPNCFPPNIVELKLPDTVSKIKFPKKDRWGDYEDNIICSLNALQYLENFEPDSSADREKAKQEKLHTIKAIGTGGLVLAEFDGYKYGIETEPVTKPRVGTNVTVNLPFEYSFEFFSPTKPKPDEREPLARLMEAIKTPLDEKKGIAGEIEFIDVAFKAIKEAKDSGLSIIEETLGKIDSTIFDAAWNMILPDRPLKYSIEINPPKYQTSPERSTLNIRLSERFIATKSDFDLRFFFEKRNDYAEAVKNLLECAKSGNFSDDESLFRIIDLKGFEKC